MLPHPGAPHIRNMVATMLRQGNPSHTLNLAVIAQHQRMSLADLEAEFARQERIELTKEVNANQCGEGK